MSRNSKTKVEGGDLDDDVDALFRLPLAEFTGARNTLAAQLKKSGSGEKKADAARVKTLAKPSVSAWAVNQLYWNHREEFDRLIASGERFHKGQTSGKIADMRIALDARREALTHLSSLATSLLRDGGHSPSPDTIHRVTTTLEAMSVYASRSDAPRPGRLTDDVDPPGFESLASFVPAAGLKEKKKEPPRITPSHKSSSAVASTRPRVETDQNARRVEEKRKGNMAAAKVSLENAKRALSKARATAQRLEAAQKKTGAEAKKAEKHRRDIEKSLEKAKAASEEAAQRARRVAVELEEAGSEVDDAERAVEAATKEFESRSGEQ
ncbi:MAG TPA: hypothetical protein VNO50_19705 [Pyrinomonadaceae bacterium]|nr:hypothetical protein [Pyrinomonadaceae bacterium]